MGERTGHTPGTFSWTDLTATDQEAAKRFYGELFGWEAEDMAVAENVSYSMMRLAGRDVAAISPQPQPRERGAPPHWLVYFGTEDIDDALARVQELGGLKLAGPIDIGIAKLGVVQDREGATFPLYAGQLEP
jgi:predicted enzyme related to lactoylglutathione lyase